MPVNGAPLNYSTQISADVTSGECMRLLGRYGASAVSITFEAREPAGLSFRITTDLGDHGYQVRVRWKGTHLLLKQAQAKGLLKHKVRAAAWYVTEEHAKAVAWRQLRDWLEGNLAMVEAGQFELSEVMLPWRLLAPGQTMFDAVTEEDQRSLTTGR